MATEPKVSVITPAFNSANYIAETIASVVAQSYTNWEMTIVDDASTDDTCTIVESLCRNDKRIRLIRLDRNYGAAFSRNTALRHSSGRFIAYLDADDLWHPSKLSRQVEFMLQRHCGFSCVSYEVVDNAGQPLNKLVRMKARLDYRGFLVNNLIQTVGVMVDLERVPRACLEMPDMKRRQDAATWLQILRAGHECHGLDEVLAQYRRTAGSLSSDTFEAVRGVWFLYRKVEKLPLSFSCYCFARYALLAVWKRIYVNRGPFRSGRSQAAQ